MCCSSTCTKENVILAAENLNTLKLFPTRCINCLMCIHVCPHAVFTQGTDHVEIARGYACMECGACQMNCPANAIEVESGVGCAAAMFKAALSGQKADEWGDNSQDCCG